MPKSTTTQCLFPDLFRKPIVARFDVDHGSSDGGGILLKAAERRLGLLDGLADSQQQSTTLLQRTAVLYGTCMGNANAHSNSNLPVLLFSTS